MSWIDEFPYEVTFETVYYDGCSGDLIDWLMVNAFEEWIIREASLGKIYSGAIRFRKSEDAVLFKLSNPFRHPVDTTTD